MAWLLGDGFDFHNAAADLILPGSIWDPSSNGLSLTAVITRFGVGVAAQVQSGLGYITVPFANSTTIFVNYAWFVPATITPGTTTNYVGFFLYDGTGVAANIQTGVFFRSGGDVAVVSNSAFNVIAASPLLAQVQASMWVHIQVKVVINNSSGSVEVRLNGNTTADYLVTGLNTRAATTNSFCNRLGITSPPAGLQQFDDFYAFNDQGAAPNSFQGDVRCVQQMPNADNSVTWTPNAGPTRFTQVDELRENGDTDYVSTATISNVDKYNVAVLPVTPLSIVAVQSQMIARMDDAGPHQAKLRLTSGATTSDSATINLTSTYQWLQQVYAVDPNTSAAWTAANLNASLIGPVDVL